MPLGGIAARTMHRFVAALAFGPYRTRRKTRDPRHGLQPAQGLKGVHRLTTRVGVFGDGVAIRLRGQVIAAVTAIVVAGFAAEFLEPTVPFKFVHQAKPLLPPFFQMALEVSRLLQQRKRFVFDDSPVSYTHLTLPTSDLV